MYINVENVYTCTVFTVITACINFLADKDLHQYRDLHSKIRLVSTYALCNKASWHLNGKQPKAKVRL